MADKTGIEWTQATWNPIVGCTHVSAGCDNCYAAREASGRLSHLPEYKGLAFGGKFTGEVRLLPQRLTQPLRWRKPRRIFVNSMSDLFHDSVPDEFIHRVFAVMAQASHHTFQLLTKRPGRARSLLNDECRCGRGHAPSVHFRSAMDWAGTKHSPTYVPGVDGGEVYHRRAWPLPNVWIGVSAETQRWADVRVPALLATPAAVRWVSAEPLLGPVDLTRYLTGDCPACGEPVTTDACDTVHADMGCDATARGLDWVVAGGESGPRARPMQPAWARSLRDQCAAAGVAFHFKQHGEWIGTARAGLPALGQERDRWADREPDAWVHDVTGAVATEAEALADGGPFTGVWRVGKKAAGRELDGQVHDGYPAAVSAR